MPRKLRIHYPGAMYHVMNRGDQRQDIFRDHNDREQFLRTLGQACRKAEWQAHAHCLMRNHFHLVIEGVRRREAVPSFTKSLATSVLWFAEFKLVHARRSHFMPSTRLACGVSKAEQSSATSH